VAFSSQQTTAGGGCSRLGCRYPRPAPCFAYVGDPNDCHTVSFVLNLIWLVLAGLWLALAYLLAALLLAVTVVGLPFAKQSLTSWPPTRLSVLRSRA
jgi:Inner membrane component domain